MLVFLSFWTLCYTALSKIEIEARSYDDEFKQLIAKERMRRKEFEEEQLALESRIPSKDADNDEPPPPLPTFENSLVEDNIAGLEYEYGATPRILASRLKRYVSFHSKLEVRRSKSLCSLNFIICSLYYIIIIFI